jgi:hypothetical protein
MLMKPRERFIAILNGEMPDDRLPMVEWAPWWDKTIDRWKGEGFPQNISREDSLIFFGLDILHQVSLIPDVPWSEIHGAPIINNEVEYENLKEKIYAPELIETMKNDALKIKKRHEAGDVCLVLSLTGFFWHPRKLLGIEPHLFAFYDNPGLMHRINQDLLDFCLKGLEELFPILHPDYISISEDMSYNLGPMISYECFKEFLLPYYKKITPFIKSKNIKVLMDSDGDVTEMIPWLFEAGIDGVYPLERQAGVDINQIRKKYPDLIMLGGFDKMIMNKGEHAIKAEFERILPVMRSGRYIPSVDHQTPPGVSFEDYKIYIRLFKEYCEKAVTKSR